MLNRRVITIGSIVSVFLLSGEFFVAKNQAWAETATTASKPLPDSQPANANKPDYEDEFIRLRLIRRSPKQIAAFYEGRQFPPAAVRKVSEACFIAAIVHNKTRDILWLDLSKWQFQAEKSVPRLQRSYWKEQWNQANIDKASQATFGWTLMPEQRDLRPDEGVGGNLTLPLTTQEFSIIAQFDRGAQRQLEPLRVKLDHVSCKQDSEVK